MLAAHSLRAGYFEVDAPEWPDGEGKPSKVRFRSEPTVADVLEFVDIQQRSGLKAGIDVAIALFAILAVNEEGVRLVDAAAMGKNSDGWFFESVSGADVLNVMTRAGVVQRFHEALARIQLPEVGQPGKASL